MFIGITNVLGIQILVPLGKEKLVFYSVLIGAIVDLIINIICIPYMASAGAALGTVIAELAVWIVQIQMLRGQIKDLFREVQIGKILVAIACSVLTCWWVKDIGWINFLTLAISACIFVGSYIIVLIIVKENFVWNIVNELIMRIRWTIWKKRR